MATTRGERLRIAREKRFKSARLAGKAMGIPVSTYGAHERAQSPGGRDYGPEDAKKYARRFGVTPEWLLTGREPFPGGGGLAPRAGAVPSGRRAAAAEGAGGWLRRSGFDSTFLRRGAARPRRGLRAPRGRRENVCRRGPRRQPRPLLQSLVRLLRRGAQSDDARLDRPALRRRPHRRPRSGQTGAARPRRGPLHAAFR